MSAENLQYWLEELSSLGIQVKSNKLSELNNLNELSNLCKVIKTNLWKKYKQVCLFLVITAIFNGLQYMMMVL